MSRGLTSLCTNSTIFSPEAKAILRFMAETARAVPQRGSDIPKVSVRIAMVLAVNSPWQEPMPGQALSSQTLQLLGINNTQPCNGPWPQRYRSQRNRHALQHLCRSSIGPAVTMIQGMFKRAAAISIPGVILSQFGQQHQTIQTVRFCHRLKPYRQSTHGLAENSASPCAPMAIPSQTPGIPKNWA